eukprot:1184819-Prorocentrum_minimum.AAC.3
MKRALGWVGYGYNFTNQNTRNKALGWVSHTNSARRTLTHAWWCALGGRRELIPENRTQSQTGTNERIFFGAGTNRDREERIYPRIGPNRKRGRENIPGSGTNPDREERIYPAREPEGRPRCVRGTCHWRRVPARCPLR